MLKINSEERLAMCHCLKKERERKREIERENIFFPIDKLFTLTKLISKVYFSLTGNLRLASR